MMRADVYWNLHKQCFSVRDRSTGRVVKHARQVALSDVTFVVQPAGQRRVRDTKRKEVHAFLRGTYHDRLITRGYAYPTYYNPYVHDTFVALVGDDQAYPQHASIYSAPFVRCYEVDGHPRVISYDPAFTKEAV